MGPTANERRIPVLTALVEDAVAKGAELLTGGARLGERGYFFQPTVLANVPPEARIMREEPFGPIAVLNPVEDLNAAIAAANAVPYGLAGYGMTNRADYIDRMIDEVEVGNLSINTLEASLPETPFGGVKASGHGREGGAEGLDSYLTVKNVWHSRSIA
jgi:succinate-semialdehyde dehydrogenase/glutarate-semialdehyde dehydrogenase